ncbi:hypothetical protein IQ06DRAFT_321925 [Phaeosphaeriaceae sp. SRC1lsM3a]|nr:hypothetical protein IQ06DRAFT_321925 [Stagonospora sp. SRC1lsM3a]
MARGVVSFISIALLGASIASAEYTQFQWPNATSQVCPRMKYGCKPPAICAYAEPEKVWYCCVPGNKDEVCHTSAAGCDGGDKKPSGAQQPCSSGVNAFCCLDKSQECTRGFNQINICWATAVNPVAKLNATMMNETYKELAAARPSAASYTIDLAQLQVMTSTTSVSSSAKTSPTGNKSTSPKPTSSDSPASDNSSSGLSGGAIGGIVGGVVGGLALIGGIAFLLWRRKKYSTVAQADPSSPTMGLHQPHASYQPDMAYPPQTHEMQAGAPRAEKYGHTGGLVGEMPANQAPVEMSAEPPRQHY